jgi:multidrug resistance efflux pump
MAIRTWLMVLAMGLVSTHALAINKCIDSAGKVSFTDQPCSGQGETLTVKPASGDVSPSASGNVEKSEGGSSSASKTGLQLEQLQDERQRREKWLLMRDAQNTLNEQIAACDAEQNAIGARTRDSNNNLAGATRNVAITNQMQAAATVCAERIRRAQAALDAAVATCDRIKCIPAY